MKEVELNRNTFDAFIADTKLPVLIDFYAPWCGPCARMRPLIDKIAEKNADKIRVGVVNIDAETDLASRFGVQSVPTLIVFKSGRLFAKSVGAKNEKQIMQLINEGI